MLMLGIYISFYLSSYTLLMWKFSYFPRISKISETISKLSETFLRYSNHPRIKRIRKSSLKLAHSVFLIRKFFVYSFEFAIHSEIIQTKDTGHQVGLLFTIKICLLYALMPYLFKFKPSF